MGLKIGYQALIAEALSKIETLNLELKQKDQVFQNI